MCVFKSYLGYHNAHTGNTLNKQLWIECYFYHLFIVVNISHITLIILFFFFFKLYNIVLVLPNIEMNLPQVYLCSPSWILLPPPSPYPPSGPSQCTSPKHPASCIEPGLAFYVWVWFRFLLLWEDINTNLVAKNNKSIVLQFLMSESLTKVSLS